MKFKHLHIENIRSYQTLDLDFPDGVTVISGVNGSGKSSILEACFMGIFGGEVLKGTALQIPDMIRKDSSKAAVILDFEHAGDDYQIEQHYRQTKTGANNSKSVLRKNGEIIAEQSKNTYEALRNLLNMDEKNFQNCAYIRQGDVDALINAKPKDRQQMIDDLLRLGKLEEYRERAHNSKTAVQRVLKSEKEKKESLSENISRLRSKNLHEELSRRLEAIEKINAAVAKKNEEKDKLSSELTLLDSQLRELEKDRAETEKLKKESAELSGRCDSEISRRENLLREILDFENKISEITVASGRLRSEINGFKNSDETSVLSPDFPPLRLNENDGNMEAVLTSVRAEESKALNEKHAISKEAEVIGVRKSGIEKEIQQKETELSDLKAKIIRLNENIENQITSVSKVNAAVEGGFSKAETEKAAFLKLFDELFEELRKRAAEHVPENYFANPDAGSEKECVSDVCDISFYSSVVKAGELPLPSDEPSWKTMISDIEKLEEHIACKIRNEEARVTDVEKKKAAVKGELDEREKNIEETEKDLRRLEEEKEKTKLELKIESAEFEKKKKLVTDCASLIDMHDSKRGEKLKTVSILKDTLRRQFNDISAKDITDAYESLSKQKEALISEIASSDSRGKEIEKAILKKEELLLAGKCPTCGQAVTVDAAHPEHGTGEEMKMRSDIAARLTELSKSKADVETQAAVLKEIFQIDEKTEQIKAEMNTFRAEEKGKAEMIKKLRKDLEENERQKEAMDARKVDHAVFCDVRREDLAKINERLTELKSENDRLNEKAALLSEREKNFSKAANSILLDYKRLEAERNMSSEFQKRLEELEAQKETAEKDLSDLKAETDKINAAAGSAKVKEERAGKVYALVSEVRAKIETLAESGNEKDKLKAVLDGRKTTMEEQDKTIDNYKKQISEKDMKIKSLTEKISGAFGDGGVSTADKKQRMTDQIRAVSETVAEWDGNRTKILEENGRIRNEISMLSEYEKEAGILRNKIHFLSFVSEDVSVLEEMYLRIRSDMRTKNIEALDRLLNEMFDFIYSNNAYSHLELDSDYNLKVHEKDGSVLEPKQLSGGERAIFNLALRCAIYRLLSFGFGENGAGKTSLPPLIFDEPTVFLDSGHVRRLIKLIEHMREDGVGQIIVVSHDESLIDSADVNFKVSKDPLTNASSVV